MDNLELLQGERQRNETGKAVQGCNDYLRMGPGRSVAALQREYAKQHKNAPPTRSVDTLKQWSVKYGWPQRAEQYDKQLEAEKNTKAIEIMQSGLALAHERVEKLKSLAAFLEGQLYEKSADGVYHNVWMADVKSIGSGQYAERVDIERFNSALIEQFRGVMDDLAKETGGRKQQMDMTSGGQPLVVQITRREED